jgi:hypothetical protein
MKDYWPLQFLVFLGTIIAVTGIAAIAYEIRRDRQYKNLLNQMKSKIGIHKDPNLNGGSNGKNQNSDS